MVLFMIQKIGMLICINLGLKIMVDYMEFYNYWLDMPCFARGYISCTAFSMTLHWQIGAVYSILWYTHQFLLFLLVFWTKIWAIGRSCSIQNYRVQVTDMRLIIFIYFGSQWLTHYGRALFSSTYPYSLIRIAELIYGV